MKTKWWRIMINMSWLTLTNKALQLLHLTVLLACVSDYHYTFWNHKTIDFKIVFWNKTQFICPMTLIEMLRSDLQYICLEKDHSLKLKSFKTIFCSEISSRKAYVLLLKNKWVQIKIFELWCRYRCKVLSFHQIFGQNQL